MNNHSHLHLDISLCVIALILIFLSLNFQLKGEIEKEYLVEQKTLCAGQTGIIYQRYAFYFIERKDMRFMSVEEYTQYCSHAGSIERKTK